MFAPKKADLNIFTTVLGMVKIVSKPGVMIMCKCQKCKKYELFICFSKPELFVHIFIFIELEINTIEQNSYPV